jgi:23S rRNA (uracil1939-C5)-methyltransferase
MTAIRIDTMLYGGSGADEAGTALPFVLPGELVELEASGESRVLSPSPERVAPGCIHFGECGGCHYQHAAYPAQLAIKTGILGDVLRAAGVTEMPAIEAHSAEPWHYRNRIRLRVGEGAGEGGGELRVGYNRYNAAGGDPLLPITMCPIATPILWKTAATLLELARTDGVVHAWLSSAVELELFTNADESALQLTLFARKLPAAGFDAFCRAVQHAVPQIIGAGVAILPRKPSPQGRRSERPKPGAQWGTPGLIYKVDDDSHWVSRGGFFQVNRHLVAELTRLATSGRSGELAWDLYAGVGLFSRALARSFAQVLAVEAAEPAATDLAAALAKAGKGKRHRALAMTALDFLQAAVVQRERPSLIVMDPPRAGIGPEVCTLLLRVRAPELVYVSCDPVTLARDLKQLTEGGYTLSELHLVDMFPQTFHMETVAVLRR